MNPRFTTAALAHTELYSCERRGSFLTPPTESPLGDELNEVKTSF